MTLSTALEVASVKAQAQAAVRGLKSALNDIYGEVEHLGGIVDQMSEEVDDGIRRPGPEGD